jgi:phospholipase C
LKRRALNNALIWTLALTVSALAAGCGGGGSSSGGDAAGGYPTTTPIKHLVVIFQENVSFDHYFGTYPYDVNPTTGAQSLFRAGAVDPTGINNYIANPTLLTTNPNAQNTLNNAPPAAGHSAPVKSGGAVNPFLLVRAAAATNDQDHSYPAEQRAFDAGAMDLFPHHAGSGGTYTASSTNPYGDPNVPLAYETDGQVMGFYDGTTVTAFWNYAQGFAINDNSFGTTFGPSSLGAVNLVSGQTNGVTVNNGAGSSVIADNVGGYTLVGDATPTGDLCSSATGDVRLGGKNIGDLLNASHISWGFFAGGFDLSTVNANGTTGCARASTSTVTQITIIDYFPIIEPFQYYASTANPNHNRPASVAVIGTDLDTGTAANQADHQYDIADFYAVVSAGNFPAVSFLKAPSYQQGHAGYSDPLDEQQFVVQVLNVLQMQPQWSTTAVIIAYDDSDGWYDHVNHIVNASSTSVDHLNGGGHCNGSTATTQLAGYTGIAGAQGRCGYGPRLPLLVMSPYARSNYVDHTTTDQSSILKFIEDNWLGSARITGSYDAIAGTIANMFDFTKTAADLTPPVFLDPTSGMPMTQN